MYPKIKLVVHCDSIPNDHADSHLFNAIAQFIGKYYVTKHLPDQLSSWSFIPIHKYGLQMQTDDVSCGVFACVNAYSLIAFKDF